MSRMELLVQHWSFDPAIVAGGIALLLDVAGYWRLRNRKAAISGRGMGRRRGQLWLFGVGVGIALIAVASPIDYWGEYYFWVHMIQHILLMLIAPFVITLAAPWITMYWGLPVGWRRRLGRAVFRSRPGAALRATGRFLTRPEVSIGLFAVIMVVWLIPPVFDLALRNQAVHVYGEHLSMFVSGMLLFTTVLGANYPSWPRASIRGQIAGIIIPGMVMWVMAIALGLIATHNWYPAYAHLPGVTLSPYGSQEIAAGELWICGDFSLLPAVMLVVKRFLDREEDNGVEELFAALFPSVLQRAGGEQP
ncbi:MAG: cytochrome c oxidase assembly protein [Acidimicrobiales bacterium]